MTGSRKLHILNFWFKTGFCQFRCVLGPFWLHFGLRDVFRIKMFSNQNSFKQIGPGSQKEFDPEMDFDRESFSERKYSGSKKKMFISGPAVIQS